MALQHVDEPPIERSLVPQAAPAGMVMPIATADEARAAVTAYERLKAAIITPSDVRKIGDKLHIKKSGWLRIARAFGLTVEPVSERYEIDANDGTWGYFIVVRAVAPNGASMQGDGACWSSEKAAAQRTRHNVRAHAFTRATNRAISNLVGGGEVSAEEITADDEQDAPRREASAWNAMKDTDIRLRLQQMGRADDQDKRGYLEMLYHEMEADGEAWNKVNLLRRLAVESGKAGKASTPGGQPS